jgi:hypothetical protein
MEDLQVTMTNLIFEQDRTRRCGAFQVLYLVSCRGRADGWPERAHPGRFWLVLWHDQMLSLTI